MDKSKAFEILVLGSLHFVCVQGCSQIMSAQKGGGRGWGVLTLADKGYRVFFVFVGKGFVINGASNLFHRSKKAIKYTVMEYQTME